MLQEVQEVTLVRQVQEVQEVQEDTFHRTMPPPAFTEQRGGQRAPNTSVAASSV